VGVAIRFALAAALLMAVCLARGIALRLPARAHALVALQGLANFWASYVCVYEAERWVASGVVAVGYAASPLVSLALARVWLGLPMSRRVALGGVAGVAGVVLIFWHEFTRMTASSGVVWGVEMTVAAVLLGSVGTVAASAYHRRGTSGWAPLAWAMAWGAAGAAVQALVRGVPWHWSWRPEFIGTLAYLAVFGSVLAFGAYYALVHRVGPAKAGYVGVLTPVVALGVSSVFEDFAWTGLTVAGIALALAGNAVALWRPAAAKA